MSHVANTVVPAMNDPSLSVVTDSMLEVYDMERHLVTNPMQANNITIFRHAVVLLVLEACLVDQITHGAPVHVFGHQLQRPFQATHTRIVTILQGGVNQARNASAEPTSAHSAD